MLWGLCDREYFALRRQWQRARDYQGALTAAVRADLHNVAGKSFDRHFEVKEFVPGAAAAAAASVEARAQEYIRQGYTPSEAAAMATSTQSREHRLHLIDSAISSAHKQKQKARKRA